MLSRKQSFSCGNL